jgi:Domain of unknown function (DUF4288)
MADSPQAARWYIAELTEEVALEGDPRPNIIHRKTRVIFADTPEDAFEKALSLSAEHEPSYLNRNEQRAQIRYWGLSELNLLDDEPRAQAPRKRRSVHYRTSDQLTPVEVAMLMSMMTLSPEALPN